MGYDYKEAMKLENQLCFPLYAAARAVTGAYTPYLKALDLTYTQYIVLLVLWEKDGVTVGEICKKLMLDSGTLSPLLKKMKTLGYIEKKHSTDDERAVLGGRLPRLYHGAGPRRTGRRALLPQPGPGVFCFGQRCSR